MRGKYISYSAIAIILLTFVLTMPTTTAMKQGEGIASFSVDTTRITLHEPVLVNFVVNNTQPGTIGLDLGADRKESFRVTITLPDGTQTKPQKLMINGLARIGKIKILPGDVYKQKLLINEWVDFPQPGLYTIGVEMIAPISTENGKVILNFVRNDFNILILPRSTQALENVCNNLLNQLLIAKSSDQAIEMATILSFIKDPVAIPYLDRMLKSGKKIAEIMAINGLERIRNPDAIEMLINLIASPDNLVSTKAKSSLGIIAYDTKDQATRERINSVLK
jgi:hypothetical protein